MGDNGWRDAAGDEYDLDDCDEAMHALLVLRRYCSQADAELGAEFGRHYRDMWRALLDADVADETVGEVVSRARDDARVRAPFVGPTH